VPYFHFSFQSFFLGVFSRRHLRSQRIVTGVLSGVLMTLILSACGTPNYLQYRDQSDIAMSKETAELSAAVPEPEEASESSVEKIQSSSNPIRSTRLLHHSARLSILVSQLNKAIERSMHLATEVGGYVEKISGNNVVIQVPAARFEETLNLAQQLGKVIDKRVAADDISDKYFDSELRLKIAKESQQRLLQLLEIAKTEDDKLALLQQLESISIDIRRLEASLEILKKKVSFAEISLQFQLPEDVQRGHYEYELPGFQWITRLATGAESTCNSSDSQFQVPENMLRIKHIEYWRVESADEVVFQTCHRDNEPRGDAAFWLQSIKFRMQTRFSDVSESKLGRYRMLRLSTTDKDAAVFYLGVLVSDNKLSWLEVKFPSRQLEQQRKPAIFQVIENQDED